MAIFQFTPNATAPFQFTANLDGTDYNVIIVWNVYRRNWYINIIAGDGTRVLTRALVASPASYDISLTAGIFTSTIVFHEGPQTFEVLP